MNNRQLGILVSALVMYRDNQVDAANTIWSGSPMADSCRKEAKLASELIDIFNNAPSTEPPIQYWSIVIPEYKAVVDEFQGYVFLKNARVIAPFMSEDEALTYAKAEKLAPYYVVCTENPVPQREDISEYTKII